MCIRDRIYIARTADRNLLFRNMLHPLVKNGSDMVVGQRIKYGLAVPAVFHQLTLFEHLQRCV